MPHFGILLFAAITVSPAGASMPPRANRAFNASGGTAPYTFVFASNASGGTLAGSLYTAGPKGGVQDVLRVADATGDTRDIAIVVGPGVVVAPSGVRLPPHGSYVFAATGGDANGYAWTVDGVGSIDNGGRYVAGPSGGATIRATDSLGNHATASVTIGPGVALDPNEATVNAGQSVTFAATGGSGAYTFSLESAPSGGTIDPSSGVYTAGARGEVTDVVVLADDLGNAVRGTIVVRASPLTTPSTEGPPEADASAPAPSSAPAPTTATGVPKHSVNLAGGGAADNACDCRSVGASPSSASNGVMAVLAAGLLLVARRRRVD